ncbi:hypothetical protein niasHT_020378 [Heterodera trifolii]|uniref:Methyltransferase type 12 domain-containing protein n=1 Tax=Heterodera trifolii TaxID=157864 RepID=A0ABD2JX64_9BILA
MSFFFFYLIVAAALFGGGMFVGMSLGGKKSSDGASGGAKKEKKHKGSKSSSKHLFMYSCDFSKKAIKTLRNDKRISSERCRPFVWEADGTLDFVLCIFVLSAVQPDRLRAAVSNLVALLRPGGMLYRRE